MKFKLLIVEDEAPMRTLLSRILSKEGYQVTGVEGYEAGFQLMKTQTFDLVFCDIMLGDKSGLKLLEDLRKKGDMTYVVMITGQPTLKTAQKAIRHGAFDFLTKPILRDALLRAAESAIKHKTLRDEKERLQANLEAIFRSVDDTIITVDSNFNLLEINESAHTLCKIHPGLIGQPFAPNKKVCRGHCVETINQAFHSRKKTESRRIHCHKQDNPKQVVKIKASPLTTNTGAFSGAVMVVSDETKMVSMEKALAGRRKFHRLVGQSQPMQHLFRLIEDLANVETTTLIIGQSGTGKELVAEAIHNQGTRKNGPMVRVNCAALTETLLESELFGHVRGAFTGAIQERVGRFQLADKGTLFLDEIGDISPALQVRLLRVLQEKNFEPVGGTTTLKVDVRVIAATNKDLSQLVKEGLFREDLLYRLKVVEIRIPPLRERKEDIPLLTEHFIQKFQSHFQKDIEKLSDSAIQALMNHAWPGNVRELEHAIEHAFVVCRHDTIDLEHLPINLHQTVQHQTVQHQTIEPSFATTSQNGEPKTEAERLYQALETTNWRREEAADLMGMSRSTFFRRIKKHGIKKREFSHKLKD